MKQVHVMNCLVKRPPVCKPLYKVIIINCMYVAANLSEMLNVILITGYRDLKIEVWLSYYKRLTAVRGSYLEPGTWVLARACHVSFHPLVYLYFNVAK